MNTKLRQTASWLKRRQLIILWLLVPMLIEYIVVAAIGIGATTASLAVQITAIPPFGVIHDLRWALVYHHSWWLFGLLLAGLLVGRSAFEAALLQRIQRTEMSYRQLFWRGAVFNFWAALIFAPFVLMLFAVGVLSLSWLFFAGLGAMILFALMVHTGPLDRHVWRTPTPLSVAIVIAAFAAYSILGGLVSFYGWPVDALALVLAAVWNAAAWDLQSRSFKRSQSTVSKVIFYPLIVVAGWIIILFASSIYQSRQPDGGGGGAPATGQPADSGSIPVLYIHGYRSEYSGQTVNSLPEPFLDRIFSYRGIRNGQPLPYDKAATLRPLNELVETLAEQVEAYHQITGQEIVIIAVSEGSLIAKSYIAIHQDAPVSRVLYASPLIKNGEVYYPPEDESGWGVAAGRGLVVAGKIIGLASDIEVSPYVPFFRSILRNGAAVRTFMQCSYLHPGSELNLIPLAGAATNPVDDPAGVRVLIIPALHANALGKQLTENIASYLKDGRVNQEPPRWAFAAHVLYHSSSTWRMPTLPLSFVTVWADAGEAVSCDTARAVLTEALSTQAPD